MKMKIKRSLISVGSIALLGLLTVGVFQKGMSTTQPIIKDIKMLKNSGITDLSSKSEIITINKINRLEEQVKQLSQQQNDLIHDMENLLLKLQANALSCAPLNLPEINKNI